MTSLGRHVIRLFGVVMRCWVGLLAIFGKKGRRTRNDAKDKVSLDSIVLAVFHLGPYFRIPPRGGECFA